MNDYDLSPTAREEIWEIWNFIARDDEEAADRWILRLVEAFDLLARNPRIGHARKDLTNEPLLFWSVENYLILYKPVANGNGNIEIVYVTEGSRDIPSYLRRRS
jgi:plasmid stabilization system protein ParE